jgi:hypothetical protein
MTVVGKKVDAAAAMVEMSNPAVDQKAVQRRRPARVPMSEVRQRLQVPEIPGYRMYWFKDENVPAAVDAYYEHVKRDELSTNPIGIGQSINESGNTDLGTNVSIIAGQNAAGQPVRLNLMKLPLEYYLEDQKLVEQRNLMVMQAIFGDEAAMFDKAGSLKDADPLTYRKTAIFNRPKRMAGKPGQASRELRDRLAKLEKQMTDKYK